MDKVLYEFDVLYLTGEREFISAEEGRDRFGLDAQTIKVELRPDDQTVEEHLIARSAVARLKTTRRTIPAETDEDRRLRELGIAS